jgi:hypothetical protein
MSKSHIAFRFSAKAIADREIQKIESEARAMLTEIGSPKTSGCAAFRRPSGCSMNLHKNLDAARRLACSLHAAPPAPLAWFTEDFEMPDLKDAKALLQEQSA